MSGTVDKPNYEWNLVTVLSETLTRKGYEFDITRPGECYVIKKIGPFAGLAHAVTEIAKLEGILDE